MHQQAPPSTLSLSGVEGFILLTSHNHPYQRYYPPQSVSQPSQSKFNHTPKPPSSKKNQPKRTALTRPLLQRHRARHDRNSTIQQPRSPDPRHGPPDDQHGRRVRRPAQHGADLEDGEEGEEGPLCVQPGESG